MSKLYEKFLKLKAEDDSKVYLLKSGIFFIALNEDAQILSHKLGFKITNLNESVIKCGFPRTRLDFYSNLLKNNNVNFEIIDSDYGKIEEVDSYLNNESIKSVIKDISAIDFNDISYKEAYNKLENIAQIFKEINHKFQ